MRFKSSCTVGSNFIFITVNNICLFIIIYTPHYFKQCIWCQKIIMIQQCNIFS